MSGTKVKANQVNDVGESLKDSPSVVVVANGCRAQHDTKFSNNTKENLLKCHDHDDRTSLDDDEFVALFSIEDNLSDCDELVVKPNNEIQRKQWDQLYSFPRLFTRIHDSSDNYDCECAPFVLQPSLFHQNNVPPTIYFSTKSNEDCKPPIGLPKNLQRLFKWKISTITPNSIRNCISFMKFQTIKPSNTTDKSYLGCWCKHMPTSEFNQLEEWRKVNHYPGSFHLGRKDKLWVRLRQAYLKHNLDSFHPQTFVLPRDYDDLNQFWSKSPSKLFIMKPPASARGNGIKVINHISQIPESALKIPDGMPFKKSTMIVQQYISNPCLLENGHKFDLRIYVLVTSVDPLRVYVCEEGLVRFASSKYTSQESGNIDQYMHLTNYFVNKNNQEYQINNDCESLNGNKWTLRRFWRYLAEHYKHVDTSKIWDQIIDIIIKTVICCEGPMTRLSHQNCKNDYTSYELFGFDIILDQDFKPWILEVNITPSLKSESCLDTSVKFRVIKDMFNLVGYHLPPPSAEENVHLNNYANCRLFFDSRLYTENLTKRDKIKHIKYQKLFNGTDASSSPEGDEPQSPSSSESILEDLTQADIRVLMLSEDELSRCGQFNRVYPSATSSKYMKYFDRPRYYNVLLNAWEQQYKDNRLEGIERLSKLAEFLD